MSLDLDAIRARHAAAISPGGEKAWTTHQLAFDVPALLAEVERLRANQADLRRIVAAQDAALATLPVTCVVCARPVEGVRCPDCQPKIVTGEDG